MTDAGTGGVRKAPWHLWVVGVLSALWNAYGCYDYTMTNVQGEAYLREAGGKMGWNATQTDAFIAYYQGMPSWLTAAWAIGVWGALAGSILLLMRRKAAVWAFAVSLAAFLLSVLYTHVLSEAPEHILAVAWMQVIIFLAAAFFLWYSWRMSKNGVLR